MKTDHVEVSERRWENGDSRAPMGADAAEQPEGSETPERLQYSDVRGIVQVVHGMSEHVVRYAHFANSL